MPVQRHLKAISQLWPVQCAFPDFEEGAQIYVGSEFSHMLVLKLPP